MLYPSMCIYYLVCICIYASIYIHIYIYTVPSNSCFCCFTNFPHEFPSLNFPLVKTPPKTSEVSGGRSPAFLQGGDSLQVERWVKTGGVLNELGQVK